MNFYDLKNKGFLVSQKAIITDGEKVLVLKNTVDEWAKGISKWELPGGLLEMEEDLEEGLKREIREETGLEIKIGKPTIVWSHNYEDFEFKDEKKMNVRIISIAFVCQKIGGEIKLSEEHREFLWADNGQLKTLDFAANTDLAINKYLLNR